VALIDAELGLTAVMATLTVIVSRRYPAVAFGIVLVGLLLASSSIIWLKEIFLTARWGALVALPVSLMWPFPRKLNELRLEWIVVGITTIIALSAFWSVDPQLTLLRAASFGLLLFGIVRLVNRRDGAQSDLIGIASVIAVLASLMAAGSVLLWAIRPDIAVFVGDLRGLLENQNGLGLFLGLTYPFVLAVMDRRIGPRVWLVAGTVPFALVIGLSESRTGAVALMVALTTYELTSRFPRRLMLHLLVAISAFMAMSISLASLDETPAVGQAPATPADPGQGDTSPPSAARPDVFGRGRAAGQTRLAALLGGRNEAWNTTADLIVDRPLLGYGFGAGDRLFRRYPDRAKFVYFQGANPNNGYLQAQLELGLVLWLVIVLPLAYAAAATVRRACTQALTVEAAALLGCLIAGLAAGIFESVFSAAGAPWALLIWLSAVTLVCRGRNVQAIEARSPFATRWIADHQVW
jgi:hypothetical protein